MSWRIELKPSSEKQYLALPPPIRRRVKEALHSLRETEHWWARSDVKALAGKLKGDYRLRVGDWRILFTPEKEARVLRVFAILPQGRAYR